MQRSNPLGFSWLGSVFIVKKVQKTLMQLTGCSRWRIAAKIDEQVEIFEGCLPAKPRVDWPKRLGVRRRWRFFLCNNQMVPWRLTGCWRQRRSYHTQYSLQLSAAYAQRKLAYLNLQNKFVTFWMLNLVLLFQKAVVVRLQELVDWTFCFAGFFSSLLFHWFKVIATMSSTALLLETE